MQTAPVTEVWMNRFAECARFLLYGIGTAHKAEMLALYDRMTEEQRQSPTGRRIDACLNPVATVGVGDRMADGDLYDIDGDVHHLAEFLGKYILLEFGSKGCGGVSGGDSRIERDCGTLQRSGCSCEYQPRSRAGVEGVYCRKAVGRKPMERTCRRRYRTWESLWGKGDSAFRADRARRSDSGCMAGLRQGKPAGKK